MRRYLNIDNAYKQYGQYAPEISNLEIIGHYSIDGNREYHQDLSQLKYLKMPNDPENIDFDLDKDYDLARHKPQTELKIDYLLRWLSDNITNITQSHIETASGAKLGLPDFICFRGTLQLVLNIPEEKYDGWIICASKLGNTIYLCQYETEQRKRKKHNPKFTSRGFKFEQYLLADEPDKDPDLSIPLNESEEFCCIFKSTFEKHSLLYGAEMDGIDSAIPIKDNTLIGKDLKFVELKTFQTKWLNRNGEIAKGERWRLLKWYHQSYLVGIKKIIVGCKDENIVREIKEYSLDDIVHLSKHEWDHREGKRLLNAFLNFVKQIVCKDCDKCLYKFTRHSCRSKTIQVEMLNPADDYKFLPDEYINKIKAYKNK